uniref:RNA polymerase-associated protein RTF1 homolog n=1 Tax=Saccoglossus kowalevskii TaxID=10224 RepID=A0ABM0GL18_SACKO|nr:PREDICTED: RNA polymerase-associated protein RTF1 homolog [Saccoglossus kowalevskii]
MTDKKSGQPESSERDALDRGEHSECEEGEVFDSTSTTPTPTDDRGDMIEVGDVDFKSEDIEQSDCDNETNNDQEMPASTQQEVPDDQQGKETRAERKMRRKLKKERKKAEKYAADLINDGHQKKKKKRKIREDEDSSPQKKSKIDTSEMESTSSDLTTEDKLLLKLEKKKKVNKLMQLPKIFLTLQEIYGRAIEKEDAIIPPLDIKNIQDLVLYSLIGMNASVIPSCHQELPAYNPHSIVFRLCAGLGCKTSRLSVSLLVAAVERTVMEA